MLSGKQFHGSVLPPAWVLLSWLLLGPLSLEMQSWSEHSQGGLYAETQIAALAALAACSVNEA